MTLTDFIRAMPKVELHVHLQGATQPETLLTLARRNRVPLPFDTVAGIRAWYQFRDFDHFIAIYGQICACIVTEDDLELMTREFLRGQAAQNIVWSEVTYTPSLRNEREGLPFARQLAAINRARAWAETALGVRCGIVIDIPRSFTPEEGEYWADCAISGFGAGVIAFGIGGPEAGNPPSKYASAFARTRAAGLPCVPHAGEVVGPESIWDALDTCQPLRIGHGVRCLEDPALVDLLRDRQIPLEVSPTSNVCLGVVPTFADHPLPRLIDAGLVVTVNSDDPPMFNTTLTDEYLKVAQTFGYDAAMIEQLNLTALRVSLLPQDEKARLEATFTAAFAQLRQLLGQQQV